jgi:MarR family transcriptional regulator for hemolysin
LKVPPHSSPTEQKIVQEIGQLLPRVRRAFWTDATRRLETVGETMLGWRVLGCVRRVGPATQCEIADVVAQHPAGVCRTLDDLEDRGLVKRTRDAADRRRMKVSLTPVGRRRWQTLLPEVVRSMGYAFEPLSAAELRTLRDILRKLAPEPNGATQRRR